MAKSKSDQANQNEGPAPISQWVAEWFIAQMGPGQVNILLRDCGRANGIEAANVVAEIVAKARPQLAGVARLCLQQAEASARIREREMQVAQ